MTTFNAESIRTAPEDIYKFLRMESGEWRFWLANSYESHKGVANGEPVLAAGMILIEHYNGKLSAKMLDPYSSTLRIGSRAEDYEALELVFGTKLD
jgi:hypothetical protein